jgi:hypothetical protein
MPTGIGHQPPTDCSLEQCSALSGHSWSLTLFRMKEIRAPMNEVLSLPISSRLTRGQGTFSSFEDASRSGCTYPEQLVTATGSISEVVSRARAKARREAKTNSSLRKEKEEGLLPNGSRAM